MRKGLQNILNISFTDTQWLQATLPIRLGGLGIRRASSLALPAFLASAAFTSEIQCASHSTGSTLRKPIRALAGINGIVADRSLSNQFIGQTGCPATSKGTFNSATILHRAERTAASESRVLPTRW